MKRLCVVALAILVFAGMAFAGGAGEKEKEGGKILLGFSHVAMNCPYYLAMDKAAKDTAAARGVEIIVLNAEEDISKQIADIESLLVKGIDGLIVNSTTEYGTMPVIKKTKSMGIPVVAIDRNLYGDYLAYVGIDQWKAGELQGEFISKELLPEGGNIVMIIGDPGCPASIGRGNGMLNILEQSGKTYKVLATYKASYNQMLGMQKMEEAMAAFGDKIDLVSDVMVCGIDGQKEAYEEIKKGGQYKSTVINNSWDITQIAVNLLVDYLEKGKEPEERDVITGTILVSAENVGKYFDPNSIF